MSLLQSLPSINISRLRKMIEASAHIGALPNGGLCRLALSDADKEMRDLFKEWMINAGLNIRVDDFGNMYGRREGKFKDEPAVLVGSHLDTQPEGGIFDGILGVLSALECMIVLNELEIETKRPIEIVNFTNEEGARFEPPMLGSGGLAGVFNKEFVLSRKDKSGKSLGEELIRIGYAGESANRAKDIYSYVELHIEQGPILEYTGTPIGAVEGIQGMTWLEVKVTGESDHAGPTPMYMRKDALVGATKMIMAIQDIVKLSNENATATIGRFSLSPNVVNSIPGEVVFTVDVRHYNDEIRRNIVEEISERISTIAATEKLELQISKLWEIESTKFSNKLVKRVLETSEKLGFRAMKMVSGAGHDAKYISHLAPSVMIFVPSINGKSHCSQELTLWEDVEKGANVLLHVLLSLAQE
jgi:beta-ureidopropionase / N-carbamoyl-L-amino-acid hydrolase